VGGGGGVRQYIKPGRQSEKRKIHQNRKKEKKVFGIDYRKRQRHKFNGKKFKIKKEEVTVRLE
jgi:hypothetical protein